MRKYLLPEEGNFYKTALHCHSTVSDGKLTPAELKAEFKKKGYSAVAFTDHELIVPHPELEDEDFLPITSYEIATNEKGKYWPHTKTYHLNVYFRDKNTTLSKTLCTAKVANKEHMQSMITDEMRAIGTKDREYSKEFIQWLIDTAKEEGAIVSYNHPVWSLQDKDDYSGIKGFFGVEWHNSSCIRIGMPDSITPIDTLVREGERKCYPIASDDCHQRCEVGNGWVQVKAPSLTYDNIFDALERGDFYSSAGPEIKELYIEDGSLHVKTSEAVKVVMFNDSRRVPYKNAPEGETFTEAVFPLADYFEHCAHSAEGRVCYIRIDVVDKNGKYARSRCYFLDELS